MTDEITKTDPMAIAVTDNSEFSMYLDKDKFEHIWRVGNLFSKSDLVPSHYKGKPENCVLAFNWATRLQIDPIQLMQKTYIIQGKPGMEAQLVIALVNARGPFEGPIQWEFAGEGDNRSCTAYAKHARTGQVCKSTVSWDMVKKEGWSKKQGSKWLTMPDQMFMYRSAVFLARLYCPEVILGFMTVDEIEDVGDMTGGKPEQSVSTLEDKLPRTKTVVNEAEEIEQKPESCDDTVEPDAVSTPAEPKKKRGRPPKKETSHPPTETTGDSVQQPDPGISKEERFVCQNCDEVFAEPLGEQKNKCPNCLMTDQIIDRMGNDD